MVNRHCLSLALTTYKVLVHGLCRVNNYEWAYSLFEEMISRDIIPRYKSCPLLYDEVKEKQMYDVADRIENIMKNL